MDNWIKVTDKLPTQLGRYLVVKDFSHITFIDICHFAPVAEEFSEIYFKGNKNPIFFCRDSEWGWVETDYVTHWLPLPPLPTGERSI